jgi:hypothetical protein
MPLDHVFGDARLRDCKTKLEQFAVDARRSCPFRKSYPDVLVMQSSQDRNGDYDTEPLDCSMQGRIFL